MLIQSCGKHDGIKDATGTPVGAHALSFHGFFLSIGTIDKNDSACTPTGVMRSEVIYRD